MDYAEILKIIEAYDSIILIRHEHPDCDALGSEFGLKTWLNENYPDKKVYALGYETTDQYPFPASDSINGETIEKSLAIVLDTANLERADDKRFLKADRIMRIDHHPKVDDFGNDLFINPKAAATAEILTELFEYAGHGISRETGEYLYAGLLTDTLCFRTNNTTASSLKAASVLADTGIDIPGLNRTLFDQSLARYQFANYLRNKVNILDGRLAYAILSVEELEKWNLTASNARNFIDEFGHVKEFEIWALFTEKVVDGKHLYDGSLRSKNVIINQLAAKFHGGGHNNACGVNTLTEEDVKNLISSLNALLN